MSEIKYVCFDIGGVANVRMSREEVISRGQQYFGADFSEKQLRQMMFPTVGSTDIWREFQNGKIPASRYSEFALSAGEIPITDKNRAFFRSLLEEWSGAPYQPVLDLVDKLKENDCHTSVLTNNNEIMYNAPGAEIKDRVHVSVSSHQIGYSKPHWEPFCVLLGKIKANGPGEVIFVDDREQNIRAAKRYGFDAFHFRSKEMGMDSAFEESEQYLRWKGVLI